MDIIYNKKLLALLIILTLFSFKMVQPFNALADRATELQKEITERNQAIQELEKEIELYQAELTNIGKEKQTLENEIRSLDITRKKLNADLGVTENKISRSNSKLESLATDITNKSSRLAVSRNVMGETIRLLQQHDDLSMIETLLADESISVALDGAIELQNIQEKIKDHITILMSLRESLEIKQDEELKIKNELTALKNRLADKKRLLDYNKQEKNNLLKVTKNNEAGYQKILNEKIALREAFEKELLQFESELNLIIDPSSIPKPGAIFSWPLEQIRITQKFGRTAFSQNNSSVYNGQGHNGIDFGVSVGTDVRAVLNGVVVGTGDTDQVCPGASYGKWVLIEHPNGLSTLYAHLSIIKVREGDEIYTGGLVGYSGNTGYSTGPHLHFTVYATQGVRVMDRKSKVCSGTYRMPIADLKAYLNPLQYLPN